jgi:hypothetical protein
MINSELGHVTTLEEFNSEIRRQQEEAHGADYCQIHDAIKKYMKDCTSYLELGTHQGGTASAAMLCNPERVYLLDIDMSRYKKFLAPIAQKYCLENQIKLSVEQADSTSTTTKTYLDTTLQTVDMLVIDSYHHPSHMTKELNLYGKSVRKYILAHDTSQLLGKNNDSLYQCLKDWSSKNGFEEIERGTTSVGYVVMRRK